MKITHLLAIAIIFAASSAGWMILSAAMDQRTSVTSAVSDDRIQDGWGPPLAQSHPIAWHAAPDSAQARRPLPVVSSDVRVTLSSDPRQRGLLRYRTYEAAFTSRYVVRNTTPVSQTVYVSFRLPHAETSYADFSFRLGNGEPSTRTPHNGVITEAVVLAAGAETPLEVTYRTRGVDEWRYVFSDNARVRDFVLAMETDFREIDHPEGTGSPTEAREQSENGWSMMWRYPDVISAPAIGMGMPSVINAGPLASRIAFFAPVSLLFYFTVMVIIGMVRGHPLHPMNYFFLAASFFAFHLLFAYLVDLLPVHVSFGIAAVVSLALAGFYVHLVSGGQLTRVALAAQGAYLVLFSYTFFFPGLTGLSITIGAVATLALLMALSARVDWGDLFRRDKPKPAATPPPMPPPGAAQAL